MRYSDESYNPRVEIDAKQFELSPDDARRLHDGLSPLDRLVEDLPASDLYVTISHHPRGPASWRRGGRRSARPDAHGHRDGGDVSPLKRSGGTGR